MREARLATAGLLPFSVRCAGSGCTDYSLGVIVEAEIREDATGKHDDADDSRDPRTDCAPMIHSGVENTSMPQPQARYRPQATQPR